MVVRLQDYAGVTESLWSSRGAVMHHTRSVQPVRQCLWRPFAADARRAYAYCKLLLGMPGVDRG